MCLIWFSRTHTTYPFFRYGSDKGVKTFVISTNLLMIQMRISRNETEPKADDQHKFNSRLDNTDAKQLRNYFQSELKTKLR